MFNSLAYNCDFQDAIGNHVTNNTSLSLSIKEKNSKLNLLLQARPTRQPTGVQAPREKEAVVPHFPKAP